MTVMIVIPFTSELNKNNRHVIGGEKVYRNKATTAEMTGIAYRLRGQAPGHQWEEKLTLVNIMVYMPRKGIDPHNFVDVICDAVEVGIGVNDSWFRAGVHVAGEVDRDNPRIVIIVSQ